MKWLLVDGNNWFARDWFARNAESLGTFQRRIETLREQFSFDRVIVAWDSPRSFRKDLSETYKTHRGGKQDGFEQCLASAKESVATAGIDSIEVPGFEGDDVLATLVATALDEGVQAVIGSSDKDLHQVLATGHVSQITNFSRASFSELRCTFMTADFLLQKYGARPWQWVDYRTITGDQSDGIAGPKGLGEKAAAIVMAKCGTLEKFYASPFTAQGLSDRQRRLLLDWRPNVALARELLTLRRDCPLPPEFVMRMASC